MLKLADLAGRADFAAGPLRVSPARRLVEGPAGTAHVEPIVMKVFLLLLDADGAVVTRDELFGNAWGGVFVGDDSLNRAIARVRRIAAETAPGLFEIETIPRTGYRLIGELSRHEPSGAERPSHGRVGRRTVIVGGLATAGAGGFGLWSVRRSQEEKRFDDLMDKGEQALGYADPTSAAIPYFRIAATMRPEDARAQGLLAYSLATVAESGDPSEAGLPLEAAERAARAALAIEPNEPNAQLAQTTLLRSMLDLSTTEDQLRQVLANAPNNDLAMRSLWGLLQSVGRSREAFAMVERAIAVEPFAAANNFPRAQLLWILGRTAEADRVIDRAMFYWPSHRFVRFAQFTILAFTGRARAALAMLDNERTRPQHFSPEGVSLWRLSLPALDQRTPASIATARRANSEAARKTPPCRARQSCAFGARRS